MLSRRKRRQTTRVINVLQTIRQIVVFDLCIYFDKHQYFLTEFSLIFNLLAMDHVLPDMLLLSPINILTMTLT